MGMALIEKLVNRFINMNNMSGVSASNVAVKASVQKVNLVADLIRGLGVQNAFYQLKFCRRKALAKVIYDVLHSAVANAENNFGLNIDTLYVKSVWVGKAFTLKRGMPVSKGRSHRISKPFSMLKIIVSNKV